MTEPQVPHSGNLPEHLREQPVNQYDNTSLPQAYEQQLLTTPETAASLLSTVEQAIAAPAGWYPVNEAGEQRYWDGRTWAPPAAPTTPHATEQQQALKPKKKGKGLAIGLSAGAAGVAVVTASIIGVNYAQEQSRLNAIAMAEADYEGNGKPEPGVVELPETFLPAREEIEIPAGLDDEAFARAVIERQSNWLNEGNEDILVDRSMEANLSWDDFIPIVTQENADAYAVALFGDSWRSNPEVAPYVAKMQEANRSVMHWYTATAWSGDEKPENIEGYYYVREFQSVTVTAAGDGQRTLEIAYTNINNANMNRYGAVQEPMAPGGVLTITSAVNGDVETITRVSDRVN